MVKKKSTPHGVHQHDRTVQFSGPSGSSSSSDSENEDIRPASVRKTSVKHQFFRSESVMMRTYLEKAMEAITKINEIYASLYGNESDKDEPDFAPQTAASTSEPSYVEPNSQGNYHLNDAFNKLKMFKDHMDDDSVIVRGIKCEDRNHIDNLKLDNDHYTPLYVKDLSYDDVVTLEQSLHDQAPCGRQYWESMCERMAEKGLVELKKTEIAMCKFPGCCKIGKCLMEHLSTYDPELKVDKVHDVAHRCKRNDLCNCLKPHLQKSKSLDDIEHMHKIEFERLVGLTHFDEGNKTWKLMAKELGLDDSAVKEIETSFIRSTNRTCLEEMIELLTRKKPHLTVQQMIETLQELQINCAVIGLEQMISRRCENDRKSYTEYRKEENISIEQFDDNDETEDEEDNVNIAFTADSLSFQSTF